MINFRCPKCDDMLSVPESVAGEKETCLCGNVCIIPVIATTKPESPISQRDNAKSFVTASVLTFVLYCLGWLPGLVANYLYLESAKKYKNETCITPEGYGTLKLMSIFFGWIPMFLWGVALVVIIISAVTGRYK